MVNIFHGWRRKAGLVTLVIAVVLLVEWMRSLIAVDVVRFCILNRNYRLESRDVGVLFTSWDVPIYHRPQTLSFDSFNIEEPSDLAEDIAILYRLTRNDRPNIRIIPYWHFVLAPTLISAYLLLWKHRN